MSYAVGQLLYVVRRKENAVIPVRVVEEITRKTLSGNTVDYVVQAGSSDDSNISLERLLKEGEVFESPEQVVSALSERAKSHISKLVAAAVQKSKQWYAEPEEQPQALPDVSDEHVQVVLPDGTVAKAKMPRAV